jgi:hypothetical protein
MIALCRRPPCCLAPRREPPDPASTAVPSGVRQHCPRLRRHARNPKRSSLLYPLHPIDVADRFSACAMHARLATDLPIASDRAYVPILGAPSSARSGAIGRGRAIVQCRSVGSSKCPHSWGEFRTGVEGSPDPNPVAHTRWCSALRALLCCNTIREGKEGGR